MPDQSSSKTAIPQLRSLEKEGTRRTTWAELLNDLVFTVIIMQLAQRLQTSFDAKEFGQFVLLYVPVWWLWNGETHYSTRFDNEQDITHRFLGSLQLLGLIVLAASIPKGAEASSSVYALTYAVVRIVLLVEYGRAWYYVPQARPYIQHLGTGFILSALLWIGSVFVPLPYKYGVWGLALLIELGTPLTSTGGRLHREFPPDVRHLPERYGLFTLLVLGQSVSGATQGLMASGLNATTIPATILGGIIIIGLWWAYFDRLDDDAVRQVSEGGTARFYALWLYLHLPLTIALTLVGIGLTYAVRATNQGDLPQQTQWLLTGSVAAYLLTEAGISLTTLKAGPPHPSFIRGIVTRFGIALVLVAVGAFASLRPINLMIITAALVMAMIISDNLGPAAPASTERVEGQTEGDDVKPDTGV
ncbi:low temperature requirement protein A [Spirosoma knui]